MWLLGEECGCYGVRGVFAHRPYMVCYRVRGVVAMG